MKTGIEIIVLIMLIVAIVNQITVGRLLITVSLLWLAHALRYINDYNE